jgi:alanine-glyoxylate transaminase/serine-glyoxylate transaminase/serine-pyruvate transaminase
VALLPDGVDDATFRSRAAARGAVLAGGLGPIAGKAFRIGHMGNIGVGEVVATLAAIAGALADAGHPVDAGAALAAAASVLGEGDRR